MRQPNASEDISKYIDAMIEMEGAAGGFEKWQLMTKLETLKAGIRSLNKKWDDTLKEGLDPENPHFKGKYHTWVEDKTPFKRISHFIVDGSEEDPEPIDKEGEVLRAQVHLKVKTLKEYEIELAKASEEFTAP